MKLPMYMYRDPVVLRRATGERNGAGEPVRLDSPIRVNWIDRRTPLRNKKGETIISASTILCPMEIQPDDVFMRNGREHIILAIDVIKNQTTNSVVYWEVKA